MTQPGDSTARQVALQVAKHVVGAVDGISITSEYLADTIQEIQVETTILGASLLRLTVIDPYWVIQRSGLLDTAADGELVADVNVNFPEGSSVWWRLVMIDGGNDLSDANLTLIFEDLIVAELQDEWGPKGWPMGMVGSTRAQFVKMLVDECNLDPQTRQRVRFVCPEINEIQPVASATSSNNVTTLVADANQVNAAAARVNKSKGVGNGAACTVKGQPISATQIQVANTLLYEADNLNAGPIASEALIYAAMGETGLGGNPTTYQPNGYATSASPQGYWGVLQGTVSGWPDPHDAPGMAQAFLTGRGPQGQTDFQTGAINWVKQGVSNPAEIAVKTEVPSIWPTDGYAKEWPAGGEAQGLAEAKAIVAAYGGAATGTLGSTGTATSKSDVSQLTRGSNQNPDEDSWTCIQRLASQVNWLAFSNAEYLYYIDGPTLAAQKPAIYLRLGDDGTTWTATDPASGRKASESRAVQVVTNLTYTFDDTMFRYLTTHHRRGRVQRRTAIRKSESAGQVKLNLVCGVFEYRGGDVIVFQNAGPLNGRWLVEDSTRNVFADNFTQLTLSPPMASYPEPQSTSSGTKLPGPSTRGNPKGGSVANVTVSRAQLQAAQGSLEAVAIAAKLALQDQETNPATYQYVATRPFPTNELYGPTPRQMDCSQFATLCYKAAGFPDPNHLGYDSYGNTSSLIAQCVMVTAATARPGDLCFFGASAQATTHVNVYVGGGQSV
ncbi:MAG: NlpC/P60 family protein, partial [Actinocrinis sp.]